ncbi:ribonuclease H-like domain-containing protein [Tanacetum coccineum]
MRTKPGVDNLSFDDLYNNLRVFENDVKGSTVSSSSTQNVAFVSKNTSSTNDVSTAYGVSNPSGHNSHYEQTSSYSLLENQFSCPQLDHEDLEQLDEFDLEEIDLKWQVDMISMRMKKFYKKTGKKLQFDAKEPVGFDKTKVKCYNCHKTGHFARECRIKGNQDSRRRDAWNSRNKDGEDLAQTQSTTQLRNQMMTYLKHVGNKKHSDLKNKTFEEIQALYEKVKRFDESFTAGGSTEDERKIKEMNEGAKDIEQKRLKKKVDKETPKKEDTTKVPAKVDVTEQGTIDSEIMERKSVIARLNKVSLPDGDYLVIYRANGNFMAFNYLLEVLYIFDRQDLFHLYDLVIKQYSEVTLEGIELILWGDLKIMMESSIGENDQSDFWNNQQNWEIVRWRLYEACGVYILELEDGTVIHILVERRYPLSKDLLQRMLDFGFEVEVESTTALDLIRFIKQQLNEE